MQVVHGNGGGGEKTKRVRHEQDSVLRGWRWGSTLELNTYIPSNGAGGGGDTRP